MKIRNGFVSNSSSSSFLIFGIHYDDVDFLKEHKIVKEKLKEYHINFEDFDSYEMVESIIPGKENSIESHHTEYDGIYIGQSWDKVADDETGLQFKKRTLKRINELLETDYTLKDLRTCSYASYG